MRNRRNYFSQTHPDFPILCYKTKEPVIYNKGTDYETSCDTFLFVYYGQTLEDAKKEADRLNREHPKTFITGEQIDWNKIDYFFADEQELFDSF